MTTLSTPSSTNPSTAKGKQPLPSPGRALSLTHYSTTSKASNWSAHRVQQGLQEFSLDKTDDSPLFFTGEMVFPWMLTDYTELRALANVAEKLAAETEWPPLYDEQQLARNEVPAYAAVYMEDMYVDFNFSIETAKKIKGCKTFVTNVMYHDAVRSKMDDVWKNIWALRDDVID